MWDRREAGRAHTLTTHCTHWEQGVGGGGGGSHTNDSAPMGVCVCVGGTHWCHTACIGSGCGGAAHTHTHTECTGWVGGCEGGTHWSHTACIGGWGGGRHTYWWHTACIGCVCVCGGGGGGRHTQWWHAAHIGGGGGGEHILHALVGGEGDACTQPIACTWWMDPQLWNSLPVPLIQSKSKASIKKNPTPACTCSHWN